MLTIDSREITPHAAIVNELRRKLPNATTTWTLDFGDYCFDIPFMRRDQDDNIAIGPTDDGAMVGIELCTPSDLIGKVDSGRLAYQLSGMLSLYDVAILLVEQPIRCDVSGEVLVPGSPSRMSYHRLMDLLFAAQSHGVIVTYAGNRDAVADTILRIYNYWRRPAEQHKTFRPQRVIPPIRLPLGPMLDSRVQNLMTIPGVGEDKALALLKRFGSLEAVYGLPEPAYKTVEGIGSGTARKIAEFVQTPITTPLDVAALEEYVDGIGK